MKPRHMNTNLVPFSWSIPVACSFLLLAGLPGRAAAQCVNCQGDTECIEVESGAVQCRIFYSESQGKLVCNPWGWCVTEPEGFTEWVDTVAVDRAQFESAPGYVTQRAGALKLHAIPVSPYAWVMPECRPDRVVVIAETREGYRLGSAVKMLEGMDRLSPARTGVLADATR